MDDQYLIMLGNPGLNPLKLFWDIVDALDQKLDAKIAVVEDVIKWHNTKLAVRCCLSVQGCVWRGKSGSEGERGDWWEDIWGGSWDKQGRVYVTAVVKADIHDAVEPLNNEDLHNVFDTVSTLLMWPCGCWLAVYFSCTSKLWRTRLMKSARQRKQWHLQDDLQYALKKLCTVGYLVVVCEFICLMQTACLFVLWRPCLSSKICWAKLWKDEGRCAALVT